MNEYYERKHRESNKTARLLGIVMAWVMVVAFGWLAILGVICLICH